MNKRAEARERDGKGGEGDRAFHAPAAVTLPLIDHEVRFVHELEGEDAFLQIGSEAVMAVPPDERRDRVVEQRVVSFLGQEFARPSVRQTRVEHVSRDRISHHMMNSAKKPVMIEKNKYHLHVRAAGDLERRIDIVEKLLVEAGGQTAIVVDDSGAAVAEHEPSRHEEPEGRHLREIACDCLAPRRHTEV